MVAGCHFPIGCSDLLSRARGGYCQEAACALRSQWAGYFLEAVALLEDCIGGVRSATPPVIHETVAACLRRNYRQSRQR